VRFLSSLFDALQAAAQFELFEVSGTTVTGATLATMIIVLLVGVMLSRAVQATLGRVLRLRGHPIEGRWITLLRLIHYVIVGLSLGIALDTMGIRLSALFAAGAVFAVGIGFAMNTIAQNFVSGVILMGEGVIKPGDVLEIEGQLVRVGEMGIRATVVRTLFDEELIVPNSVLVQSTVKNLTHHDRLYRLRVQVGVHYDSDMAQVSDVLTDTAVAFPTRVRERTPRIQLIEFGSSSVDWEVSLWIDDPWEQRVRSAELRRAIWDALKGANITIAYPQMDVHFDRRPEPGPE
jgi:potassium efflux system protein